MRMKEHIAAYQKQREENLSGKADKPAEPKAQKVEESEPFVVPSKAGKK